MPLWMIPAGIAAAGAIGYALNQDDDISSPTFADINLERDNPAMWEQIQKNRMAIEGAKRALEARRQGMTDMERRRVAESRDQLANQQSHLGLLGSSVGANAQASMVSQLQADIAERAFQEEFQRRQYMDQLQGREADLYNTGLTQAMQGKQGQYQHRMAEQDAKNQFWGGIMGAGIGVGGSMIGGAMAKPAANSISTGVAGGGTYGMYNSGGPSLGVDSSIYSPPPQFSSNMVQGGGYSVAQPNFMRSPQGLVGGRSPY